MDEIESIKTKHRVKFTFDYYTYHMRCKNNLFTLSLNKLFIIFDDKSYRFETAKRTRKSIDNLYIVNSHYTYFEILLSALVFL